MQETPQFDKITLYIAEHNITGKKYFGKTTRWFTEHDLQEYYHGSGIYWRNHLKTHGDNVTMSIYGIFNKDEVEEIALRFSKDNDIIESDEWANQRFENGLDGGSSPGWKMPDDAKKRISLWSSNRRHSDESKKKIGIKHKCKIVSEETKEKLRNYKRTAEQKHNISLGAKNREILICPHCGKSGDSSNMQQHHFDNCCLIKPRKTIKCEFCEKEITPGNYKRWHGENCKMNPNITSEQLKKREPWNKKIKY